MNKKQPQSKKNTKSMKEVVREMFLNLPMLKVYRSAFISGVGIIACFVAILVAKKLIPDFEFSALDGAVMAAFSAWVFAVLRIVKEQMSK